MFSWIWGKALLGAGIIAGFLGVLAMSRREGAKAEKAKQAEATIEARARVDKVTASAAGDKAELERRLGKPGARL
jgi:hypothetical protein